MIGIPKPRQNQHTNGYNRQYLPGGIENLWVNKEKKTTVFHNKMYTDAYKNNWLDALAIWLMLFKKYPNKKLYFVNDQKNKQLQELSTELGVSKNTLISKMKILKLKGFLKYIDFSSHKENPGTLVMLSSNEDIINMYKCRNFGLYVNMNNVNTYKDLKYFLKQIPILSNLISQKNKASKHIYFSTLRQELNSGAFVDHKEHKALCKYEKSLQQKKKLKVKNKGTLPNLSLKGICRVTGRRSSTTSLKYKNFLISKKVIAQYNRTRIICDVESRAHFDYLKYQKNSIPKHSLYSKDNNIAYVFDSSLLFITSDKWSMEAMDQYYDQNLKKYVEDSISQRNCFLDMIWNAKLSNIGMLSNKDRSKLVKKHGPGSITCSNNMAELLKNGYKPRCLWYMSSIKYKETVRNGRGRGNCTFTKEYEYNGLMKDPSIESF